MQPRTRRIVVALFAAFIVIMLVVSMAGTAGAHNDFSDIAVEVTSDPENPKAITIRARLTYSDDGHPVEDGAVVTYAVAPTSGDAAAAGEMARVGEGQYEVVADVGAPGDYVISMSSENPQGGAVVDHVVADVGASTTTTSDPDSQTGDDSDEVMLSWPIVIAGLVFLGAVGVLVVVAVRRRA